MASFNKARSVAPSGGRKFRRASKDREESGEGAGLGVGTVGMVMVLRPLREVLLLPRELVVRLAKFGLVTEARERLRGGVCKPIWEEEGLEDVEPPPLNQLMGRDGAEGGEREPSKLNSWNWGGLGWLRHEEARRSAHWKM